MKQLVQNLKSGETLLESVPVPIVKRGSLLIRTTHTLVSLGTERMLVEFGKASLFEKARQQPDKVKQVLDKIAAEGLLPTLETVFSRLNEPLPLGYCNVGVVEEVGAGVTGFMVGDRVASNGKHAEFNVIPENLVAKIPDNVSAEAATFTVIGSIGLQGLRLCNPTFGETIVVVGLGLIGLLTAQMLRANGCQVIGVDIDESKCVLAQQWGIHTVNPLQSEVVKSVMEQTRGIGADGVIITASAKNNDIISQAAQMSRKRGRIILVGVIGLNISRADFYEKELSFQVSCSYGPGRYDSHYEDKGIDYPLPFVRWTEKRNFEAILQALSSGSLQVDPLITERVPFEEYQTIYSNMGQSKSIASIMLYSNTESSSAPSSRTIKVSDAPFAGGKGTVGLIGAGNFAKMTMLPKLKKTGAQVKYIASAGGLSGTDLAKKFGVPYSTTDYTQLLSDTDVDVIMISTRHSSHAKFVTDALEAGKHVFVEKPLAITVEQMQRILLAWEAQTKKSSIMVGFNRRFSPHIQAIKRSLGAKPGPVHIVATMNAGFIPKEVWVHDMEVGGGRIIGEACHYIDLCMYLCGSEIDSVCMNAMGPGVDAATDNASILLKFKNGSNAVVNYFANGSKAYSKERVEVYSLERTWVMDNFRTTTAYGVKGFKNLKTRIDKGHEAQFAEYIARIKEGGDPLIPLNEIVNVTKASFAALESLQKRAWIEVGA